ncbi:hypothetical protein MMC29_007745 [Sticta canariensis]|nr:hypothetical protein [Sticta canariensis]
MDTDPFCLTFGVELEFIVRFSPESYKDDPVVAEERRRSLGKDSTADLHQAYGSLVRKDMVKLLNENGIPANGFDDFNKDFKMWNVYTDSTVVPLDSSEGWYPIELISPVLVYSAAALEKIERVVELLVSNFALYANESCGLHVHVGNADRGFSLRTLKNFCSLITVFEDQLASLHTIDRVHNPYAKSTSTTFYPRSTTKEKLSAIDQMGTVDDVVEHFTHTYDAYYDKNLAFNFLNLQEGDDSIEPLRTIEFRQHRGTLDPKLITNWVMVTCNLIGMSYANKEGFHDLIKKHTSISDTKYTIIDLFKDLELSELAEFYEPLTILLHGTDQNPAGKDEFRDGVLTVSAPGKYYTPWEKEFAPWPPFEQKPYRWTSHGYIKDFSSTQWESLLEVQPWENRLVPNTAEDLEDEAQPWETRLVPNTAEDLEDEAQPWENRLVPNTAEDLEDGSLNHQNSAEHEKDEDFW